jgi:hypothetical protein
MSGFNCFLYEQNDLLLELSMNKPQNCGTCLYFNPTTSKCNIEDEVIKIYERKTD